MGWDGMGWDGGEGIWDGCDCLGGGWRGVRGWHTVFLRERERGRGREKYMVGFGYREFGDARSWNWLVKLDHEELLSRHDKSCRAFSSAGKNESSMKYTRSSGPYKQAR